LSRSSADYLNFLFDCRHTCELSTVGGRCQPSSTLEQATEKGGVLIAHVSPHIVDAATTPDFHSLSIGVYISQTTTASASQTSSIAACGSTRTLPKQRNGYVPAAAIVTSSCESPSWPTVVATLNKIAGQLGSGDHVDLWEFDTTVKRIGSTRDQHDDCNKISDNFGALTSRLSGPSGGTEIGKALATVAAKSSARDVVVLTDGKSHALDVQMLARTGRRFTVVLVGEDSLEGSGISRR
jgi:hypothetical protein